MSEEEKEKLEQEFQYALDNIVSKIKGETATAIVVSEQSMILLFKKLMLIIEKQSKEIEELKEENQRYKRIASKKLDDIEEFRKNECEHRCIKNAEVLELKEYYNENYIRKDKIKEIIEGDYTDIEIILEIKKLLEE